MAFTLNLTDGTTTLNLLGSTYKARAASLDFGNPNRLQVESANIFSSRWDLVAHQFTKRRIQMRLRIEASTIGDLSAAQHDINNALRQARNHTIHGTGSRWDLTWNPGGTSEDIKFRIQSGELRVPPADLVAVSALQASNPYIANAILTLETDPFGEGAEETIENYCPDPSFEVDGTDLADWTQTIGSGHTATTTRVTTQKLYGNASLKIAITGSGAGVVDTSRHASTPNGSAAATEVWSFSVWYHVVDNASAVRAIISWRNSSDTELSAITLVSSGSTTTTWTQAKSEGQTAPSNTDHIRITLAGRTSGSGQNLEAYFDGVMIVKAATIPTTWVSGRAVHNHFDDDGQVHVNYIDIHPNGGDWPAAAQVKFSENENHTAVWTGSRHGDRQYDDDIWHEGEGFAGTSYYSVSAGSQSDGNIGRHIASPVVDAASGSANSGTSTTHTLVHTVANNTNRLLVVGVSSADRHATGVTYAGDALTKVSSSDVNGGDRYVSLWYRVAPDVGVDQDIVATFASSSRIIVGAVSFIHVNQSSPVGTVATAVNAGSVTSTTVDVTTVANEWVFDAMSLLSSATVGSGQTQRWNVNQDSSGNYGAGSTEQATGTTTTMSWTFSSSRYAFAAVPIKGLGSGATETGLGTAASPDVVTKALATPPKGTYRVLARMLVDSVGGQYNVAMGYSYGGVTEDPSVAAHYTAVTETSYTWHDIGSLVIPPSQLPENATIGTFTLRLCFYRTSLASTLDIDALMLLPVDVSSNYVAKPAATDVVVLDSISHPPSLALWNTSDVFQSRPQQEGSAPFIDPDGTRLYFVSDNGSGAPITHGAKTSVVLRRRYLMVG